MRRQLLFYIICIAVTFPSLPGISQAQKTKNNPSSEEAWVSDQGDGTYRNPIIHADYSDPDVVRVGDDSRQYYKNCYIEGTVDLIFGWSTAVFENCEIFCKGEGGYVTAASTLEETPYGFVFINCKITGSAPENSFYLGRPWRPYAHTVFIHCFLDKHIKPEGWHNWNKPEAESTAFYAEYQSEGPGAQPDARAEWSYQLTTDEAEQYTVNEVLKGEDHWNPAEVK